MAILAMSTCWWAFAALLALSSTAPTDQVPLSSPSVIRRFMRADQTVEIPASVGNRELKLDEILHNYGSAVQVKYLHFDDTWFGNLSNTSYTSDWEGFMQFNRFNVFDAETALENGFIDSRDLDCSASKPNALHNTPLEHNTPSVIRSNATALAAYGLSEFFDVIAWTWKPLGPAPENPYLTMNVWRIEDSGGDKDATFIDSIGVVWPYGPGFFDSDTFVPADYFYDWGQGVNWIDFEAKTWDTGDGTEPIDFCLDNLVLLFYPKE